MNDLPPGLLAQVVPSHASDFHLLGSSPSINTYPAPKKKKKKEKKMNDYQRRTKKKAITSGELAITGISCSISIRKCTKNKKRLSRVEKTMEESAF